MTAGVLSKAELLLSFTTYDIHRLELYSTNMVDYHLIVDLLPELARLFFTGRIAMHLSAVQSVSVMSAFVCVGFRHYFIISAQPYRCRREYLLALRFAGSGLSSFYLRKIKRS